MADVFVSIDVAEAAGYFWLKEGKSHGLSVGLWQRDGVVLLPSLTGTGERKSTARPVRR